MDDILKKLIDKKPITKKDIEHALYEICDRVHAECDEGCPVYVLNGNKAPECSEEEHFGGCLTFKDGKAMLAFIKKRKNTEAWREI